MGERQSLEVEKKSFQRLIRAIEGIGFEEDAEASAADSLVEEGAEKDSTVLVEHVEVVTTDDESIYADAEEVQCF